MTTLVDVPVAVASDFPRAIGIVDATEVPIPRPTMYESRHNYVHHRQYCTKLKVGCLGEPVPERSPGQSPHGIRQAMEESPTPGAYARTLG